MRYVVVGLGNIGGKRQRCARGPLRGHRRPVQCRRRLSPAPRTARPTATTPPILAVPNDVKLPLLGTSSTRGKHVLVEKPLILDAESADSAELGTLGAGDAIWYTSYNFRFEPHVIALKRHLEAGAVGSGVPGADVLRERHRGQHRGDLARQPAGHPRGHGEPPHRPHRLRLRPVRRRVPGVGGAAATS